MELELKSVHSNLCFLAVGRRRKEGETTGAQQGLGSMVSGLKRWQRPGRGS
jgi:hypothetical protein